jgi:hypothetical protein
MVHNPSSYFARRRSGHMTIRPCCSVLGVYVGEVVSLTLAPVAQPGAARGCAKKWRPGELSRYCAKRSLAYLAGCPVG